MRIFAVLFSWHVCFIVFVLVLLPTALFAEALRNQPPGSYGWARAGGKIAHIDDASAVSINPANLSDIGESTLVFAPALDYVKVNLHPDVGQSSSTRNNLHLLPSFFMSVPSSSNDRLTWGFGISVPYGQASDYDENFVYRYQAPHFSELVFINFTPALAYRVSDNVSIGLGMNISYSELELRQAFPWALALATAGLPDGNMEFKADGIEAGIDVGLTWRIDARNRLAFVYKFAIDMDYSGDFNISNLPAAATAIGATSRSDFNTSIKYPSIFTVGYGHEINDRFNFGIDIEWVEWSNLESLNLDVSNNSVLFPSTVIPGDWGDTMTIGFGFDYWLDDTSYIRGGYWHLENPIPSRNQQPYLPESNQNVYTIGYGFKRGPYGVEFSYGYVDYNDRPVSDNVNPAFNGYYDKEAQILALTFSYNR